MRGLGLDDVSYPVKYLQIFTNICYNYSSTGEHIITQVSTAVFHDYTLGGHVSHELQFSW